MGECNSCKAQISKKSPLRYIPRPIQERENESLNQLKYTKFLTQRIFSRVSENMHYEIFKYMDCYELLQVRAITLGGFQLTSNKLLRSRIKNYFPFMELNIEDNADLTPDHNYIYSKLELILPFFKTFALSFENQEFIIDEDIAGLNVLLNFYPQISEIKLSIYI